MSAQNELLPPMPKPVGYDSENAGTERSESGFYRQVVKPFPLFSEQQMADYAREAVKLNAAPQVTHSCPLCDQRAEEESGMVRVDADTCKAAAAILKQAGYTIIADQLEAAPEYGGEG